MEPRRNILSNISSEYTLKLTLSYLNYRAQLKLFQYSKKFQRILGMNIFTYQKFSIFKDIYATLQKGEDKIEFYYNDCDKEGTLLNLFERNKIKDKNEQKDLLNKLFLDVYKEYSKNIYVIIDDSIQYENFLDLISINAPIKIKLIIESSHFFLSNPRVEKSHETLGQKATIMKILDYNDKINNIEINLGSINDYDFFEKKFLDKINKLNNLEETSISCELFSELSTKKYHNFFKNKFKTIEVLTYNEKDLLKFCSSFKKVKSILKENKFLDKLKIKRDDEYPEDNSDETISLSGMSSIKNLELDGLYVSCEMNNEISKNLSNLFINHTFMDFKDKLIQFSNLKILHIENTFLSRIFKDNVDFSSLSNLEHLSVEFKSFKDYIFLIKILLSSHNLIEFKLINSYKAENNDDYDLFDYCDNVEEDNDSDDDCDDYEKYLKIHSKKLLDAISNLNYLKSLSIFNYEYLNHISNFLTIFDKSQFKILNSLNTNCLGLNEIKKLLSNNPSIEIIDLENLDYHIKNSEIEENFNFIENKNINLKKIFLKFDFSKFQLQNKGSLYINPSTLQVIKLKDMFICDSSFFIFIDNKISFDNLIEFKLKNDNIDESQKEEKQNILMKFVNNFKNFQKLKILSIMDRCIDKNFVNDFIKKNSLGLTKLKLETKPTNYDTDILNDYFIDLYPNLKLLEKLKINVQNKERANEF